MDTAKRKSSHGKVQEEGNNEDDEVSSCRSIVVDNGYTEVIVQNTPGMARPKCKAKTTLKQTQLGESRQLLDWHIYQ